MLPQRSASSRYLRSARAAYLARVLAAGAVVVVPAACGGSSDADVFSAAEATTDDVTADDVNATASTVVAATAAPATASATVAATTAPAPAAAPAGATFPDTGELVVDFTYTPSDSGGRVRNPYVAVWVEDSTGAYVATVAVWYEQSNKGTRYLDDLRAWMTASNGAVSQTSTGATRSPGTYSVVWDGTDLDGNKIAQGDYVLYVEAAREHGPYEITSTPLTIGTEGFSVALPDNGELSALTATLTA